MRLAIANLTGGGMSGGYRNYLLRLVTGFCASPSVSAILCAAPARLNIKEWLPTDPKLEYADCAPFSFFRFGGDAGLDSALNAFRPDIVFVPVERYFKYRDVPVVCMIQNMAPLIPHGRYALAERLRMAAQRYAAKRAVEHADRVVAISGFVRDFLQEKWKLPKEKVSLVHLGASAPFGGQRKPAEIPPDWAGKYFLSAGSLEPYRGLEDLVRAVSLLRVSGNPVKLVIAGGARQAVAYYAVGLKKLAADAGVASDIIWLGQVPAEQLNWCYRNCAAFVMTSRVEALPGIALEALAHNCICVSSDNPPMPEVFGNAAVYYPSGDPRALAARLSELSAAESAWRDEMRERAAAASSVFGWNDAVSSMLAVFRQAIKK